MNEVKGFKYNDEVYQYNYEDLLNKPNTDKTLKTENAFADAKAAGSIVKVSSTQPTEASNKIWVEPEPSMPEVTVPTMEEFTALKEDFIDITGNNRIPYTVINGYYSTSTVGATVSGWTALQTFNAAMIDCAPGDVFTINGKGGFTPRLWAFLDSSNKVTRRETTTEVIREKIIKAESGEVKLVINNDMARDPNAISYYGNVLNHRVDVVEDICRYGLGVSYTHYMSVDSNGNQHNPDGSTTTIGKYWNWYSDWGVSAGDIICLSDITYSGSALVNVILNGVRADASYKLLADRTNDGDKMYVIADDDYTRIWVQFARSSAENNVNASFYICSSSRNGIVGHVLENERHVYHVEKDGSGDFTNLVEAIKHAEQFMDSIVYVGAGTWDIISELGSDYVQSVSFSKRGIVLKNRIHLIFSSEALVTCIYEGINGVIKDDTVSWLSAFNAGEYGFTLENCRIQSQNVRYSVHDEMGLTNNTPYINRYINCQMTHNNQKYDQSQGTHGYAQCIGGGLGTDGYIEITGCVFENSYQYSADTQGRKVLVSYHTQNSSTPSRSQIEIKGCYFKDNGTCRGTYINTNSDVSTMLVHDNSLGKEPFTGAETQSATVENIEMIAWNNEIRTA